jgi:probable F420-dependent oxidoreductase
MRFGIATLSTDRTLRPDLAAAAIEERGFHAFYTGEHTHIPVSRRTPHPLTGEHLDDMYRRTLDPWVALPLAAGATSALRLGTSVALPAEHDPIVLAKQIATLDHLSGGRVIFGIGFGWNREEMEHHGVDPARRRDVVREKVMAMQAIWSQDEAAYEGEFVRFEAIWSWPKPAQARVPVWFGSAPGPKTYRHLAEYGDGWMPNGGSGLRTQLPLLREAWQEAGRDGEPEVVVVGVVPDDGKLDFYASLGVTEVVLGMPAGDLDAARAGLDALVPFIERHG